MKKGEKMELKIENFEIKDLIAATYNPRKLSEKQQMDPMLEVKRNGEAYQKA